MSKEIEIVDYKDNSFVKKNNTGIYIPKAISSLTTKQKELLKNDTEAFEAFTYAERHKISQPTFESLLYFCENYGAGKPPGSYWIQLELPDYQIEMLKAFYDYDKVVVLKARRMGFTTMVTLFFLWHACFNPHGFSSKNLALNKKGSDAENFIWGVRNLISILPVYIRPEIGSAEIDEYGDSQKKIDRMSKFEINGRGHASLEAVSTANSSGRSLTADKIVVDEHAHLSSAVDPYKLDDSINPVVEGGGQLISGSTGNGQVGTGAFFADKWLNARQGKNGYKALYYGWQDRPDRDQEWYDKKLAEFEYDETRMGQEYPDKNHPEQALMGNSKELYFNFEFVNKSIELGKTVKQRFEKGEYKGGEIVIAVDYGTVTAFNILLVLPRGGLAVIDEYYDTKADAPEFIKETVQKIYEKYVSTGYKILCQYFDSNGKALNPIFVTATNKKIRSIPTVLSKNINGKVQKDWLTEYLRNMMSRNNAQLKKGYSIDEMTGYFAISPDCTETIRQFQSAKEKDGKIEKKSNLSHSDDHNMDAVFAGSLYFWNVWRTKYNVS